MPVVTSRDKQDVSEADRDLQPADCVLRHVTRTSRAIVSAYDPFFAPFGLSGHQFNLLHTLLANGPRTVGRLAADLGADPSSIPRAVRPLVARGCIAVTTGRDRRTRLVALTEQGEEAVRSALPAWREAQAAVVAGFGGVRWDRLMLELRDLRRAARDIPARPGAVAGRIRPSR